MSLFSLSVRRSTVAALAALLLVIPAAAAPAAARPAPDGFADLADKLLPSVVNISTTQTLKPEKQKEKERATPGRPQFPPGSPFEEFFAFYRSLQAYREGLNGKDTSFVLSPEGNFFRFFGGWAGEGAAAGTASGSAPRATR